jgi:hypothetical protein
MSIQALSPLRLLEVDTSPTPYTLAFSTQTLSAA